MDATVDLSTATPAEIDTVLAEIYTRLYKNWDEQSQHYRWIKDYQDGLARKAQGATRYLHWSQDRLVDLECKYEALQEQAIVIENETHPYESEYRRRPWSRFFHVTNANGHIHSSMTCSTCFPTTRYAWLTEMSGQSEEDALEALGKAGHVLCSVCFPNAPVELFSKREDPSVCPGSGSGPDWDQPHRKGYMYGNWGTCPECGQQVAFTNSRTVYKLRKHKRS